MVTGTLPETQGQTDIGEVAEVPLDGLQLAQVQLTCVQQAAVKLMLKQVPIQAAAGAVGETVGVKLGFTATFHVQEARQLPSYTIVKHSPALPEIACVLFAVVPLLQVIRQLTALSIN